MPSSNTPCVDGIGDHQGGQGIALNVVRPWPQVVDVDIAIIVAFDHDDLRGRPCALAGLVPCAEEGIRQMSRPRRRALSW
jgi:hypothetical protein